MPYKKAEIPSKYFQNLFNSLPSLNGKTIAITGTTSGTGFVAAKACLKLGARVLVLNRPSDRSQKSLEVLKTENSNTEILPVDCDLQSFNSVRQAGQKNS